MATGNTTESTHVLPRFAVCARQVSCRVCRLEVLGDGHAMLVRAQDWSELTSRLVAVEFALRTSGPLIEDAMHRPTPK
jgi:hypothetical protein